MAEKLNLAELTYSSELFGFSPLIVQEELEKKLSSLLDSNIKTLNKKLGEKCTNELQKETLQKSLNHLKKVFHQKSRKLLEEFNSSIVELLKMPPHVLFPADEVHRTFSNETFDTAQAEHELKKTQLLIAIAKQELKVLNEIESSMQDVSECRHFIELLHENTSDIQKDLNSWS